MNIEPNQKVQSIELTSQEKELFETEITALMEKHGTTFVCKPFITNEGRIDSQLLVFKKNIPSPYGGIPSAEKGFEVEPETD